MPLITSAVDFVQKMNSDVRYKWVLMNCYDYDNGRPAKSFEEAQRWYQRLLKQYPKNCRPVIDYINGRISQIFNRSIGIRNPIYLTEPPHEPQQELIV